MANDVMIRTSTELREVAEPLIERHHEHLEAARLLYLETDAKVKCRPKLLSPFERFLSNGYDFALIVNVIEWAGLDDGGRAALADHLLSHCGEILDDEGGRSWVINRHDVEEFAAVVERHGPWHAGLRELAQQMRQLPLPSLAEREPAGMGTR